MLEMADVHGAGDGRNRTGSDAVEVIEAVDVLAAHHSGDHVLAMYVAAFNEMPGSQMDITVFSGGFAFSGRLVGAPTYFETVAEAVDNEAVAVPFRQMAKEQSAATADDTQLLTTYLHMLDVTVFAGTKRFAELTAWRGRLSYVSGWTAERITPKR